MSSLPPRSPDRSGESGGQPSQTATRPTNGMKRPSTGFPEADHPPKAIKVEDETLSPSSVRSVTRAKQGLSLSQTGPAQVPSFKTATSGGKFGGLAFGRASGLPLVNFSIPGIPPSPSSSFGRLGHPSQDNRGLASAEDNARLNPDPTVTPATPTAPVLNKASSHSIKPTTPGSSTPSSICQGDVEIPIAVQLALTKSSSTPNPEPGMLQMGSTLHTRVNPHLLEGPGIELVVGPSCAPFPPRTWSIPKALVCYYSPFLRNACINNSQLSMGNRITRPNDDVFAFSLFIQWLYYGTYILPLNQEERSHVRAWILGDKLMATGFKNFAMRALHALHVEDPAVSVTAADIDYVCTNTGSGSMLRKFFLDIAATHFTDPSRVRGTTEEWSAVLQKHKDATNSLLGALRLELGQRKFLKGWDSYLEKTSTG